MEKNWEEGLLVVERMLLESLERGAKTLDEIVKDTGLVRGLLGNLIPGLARRGIITFEGGRYHLNLELKTNWLPQINDSENVKEEMRELFSSLINQKFSNLEGMAEGLKMQKIWLTKEEEWQLQSQLKSLELFIKNVQDKRKREPQKSREVTREKRVIFWGQASYSDLVKGTLEAC